MYQIDIRNIASKAEFHDKIRSAIEVPDYYGNNLDALFDVLTEIGEETHIEFIVPPEDAVLGDDVKKLLKGLTRIAGDITEENPNVTITLTEQASEQCAADDYHPDDYSPDNKTAPDYPDADDYVIEEDF